MVFTVIVRRLVPGAYDDFRRAWEPVVWPQGMVRNWLARNDDDPDVVASITLLDLDQEGLEQLRDDPRWVNAELSRLGDISEFEQEIVASGFFHVVEEHGPPVPAES
jgi:hypothetical protein